MEYIIKYIAEIIITIVATVLINIYKKLKKQLKTIELNKSSTIAIIKNIYVDKFYLYKNKNCISLEEKETLNNLYHEYKKLGGNGIIDELREELDDIPINKNC